MTNFFRELKRRSVYRVTIAYLVVSWGIIEVSDILIPVMGLPNWTQRLIFLILVIGIVPTLIAAWALELTPNGIRIDRGEGAQEHWQRQSVLKMRLIVIGGLAFIIAILVIARLYIYDSGEAPAVPAPTTNLERSVAVLPFHDFSQRQDRQWFADGISEEITNALARMPDIMVASRLSSMLYRGSEKDVSTIGRELGVAHVLEGSIRTSDSGIRVTAQLIRVSDGFHVWSQTYDRPLEDVIGIQEDVAMQIATALDTTLNPKALEEMVEAGTRSVRAYQAYIRGISLRTRSLRTADWEYYLEAYEQFETARSIDPKFSASHGKAAEFWLVQLNPARQDNGLTDLPTETMHHNFMERIDLAIDTAKNEAERSGGRARRAMFQLRLRNALRRFGEYLEARPNDLQAWSDMLLISRVVKDELLISRSLAVLQEAGTLDRAAASRFVTSLTYLGDASAAADYGLRSLQRWPNDAGISYQTHRALLWAMRIEEASGLLSNIEPIVSDNLLIMARQACAEKRRNDVLEILEEFRQLPHRRVTEEWLVLEMLGEHGQAEDLLQAFADSETPFQLASWLTYPMFDPSPYPFLLQMLERENIDRAAPVAIPYACPE